MGMEIYNQTFLQHSPQHTITCAGIPSYRGPNLILTGADLSSIMPLKSNLHPMENAFFPITTSLVDPSFCKFAESTTVCNLPEKNRCKGQTRIYVREIPD